jgi:ribosomal protein S18 acetylase RimI-like enzyme
VSRAGGERSTAGVVREARIRDLDRVAALWISITLHHEPLDPLFRMRADADSELRELLSTLLRDPDASVLVYDQDGDLPGLCIVRIDHAPPILEEVERAEITDLGVREGLRRRGIGAALVSEALRWIRASGVRRVEVQVAHGNESAQGFWRSQGFGDLMDVLHKRL